MLHLLSKTGWATIQQLKTQFIFTQGEDCSLYLMKPSSLTYELPKQTQFSSDLPVFVDCHKL